MFRAPAGRQPTTHESDDIMSVNGRERDGYRTRQSTFADSSRLRILILCAGLWQIREGVIVLAEVLLLSPEVEKARFVDFWVGACVPLDYTLTR